MAHAHGGDERIYNLIAEVLHPSNDDISTIFDQELLTHLSRNNLSINPVSYISAFFNLNRRPGQIYAREKRADYSSRACQVQTQSNRYSKLLNNISLAYYCFDSVV